MCRHPCRVRNWRPEWSFICGIEHQLYIALFKPRPACILVRTCFPVEFKSKNITIKVQRNIHIKDLNKSATSICNDLHSSKILKFILTKVYLHIQSIATFILQYQEIFLQWIVHVLFDDKPWFEGCDLSKYIIDW